MIDPKLRKIFPKSFLWGASVATHQVEGGNNNQWTEWENKVSQTQANTAEKRLGWLPSWNFVSKQASSSDNYISGSGIEHYTRYKEDFKLLKSIGLNSFRSGIEWSRIMPSPGQLDQKQLEHYRKYYTELKTQKVETFMTLWHWTMPTWFTDLGGFEKRSNLVHWKSYIHCIVESGLLDYTNFVITLNEPNVYVSLSYILGEWPPQQKNVFKGLAVYLNLVRAHKYAYKVIKTMYPDIQIGVAAQLAACKPKNKYNLLDIIAAKGSAYLSNWWFLNRIEKHVDYSGFNFYFRSYISALNPMHANPDAPLNDLGWYMEPYAIREVIAQLHKRYKKPIYITENGLADQQDRHREWWLSGTLKAIAESLEEGCDVRGYLHWSLLDNFEWAYGWFPKFGLVAVDRVTMKRTIRASAKKWAIWLTH